MNVFPLPEKKEYIEDLLGVNLYDKCLSQNFKVVKIPTRDYVNYFEDGRHTNDINEIKNDLIKYKIEFKEL
jgi:DNA modification methylase